MLWVCCARQGCSLSSSVPGSLSLPPSWTSCSAVTLFLCFLVPFPPRCFPSYDLTLVVAHVKSSHSALCLCVSSTTSVTSKWPSLSFIGPPVCHCQWVPPTATPTWSLLANVWPLTPHSNLHFMRPQAYHSFFNYCMRYVLYYLTSLIQSQYWRGIAHLSPPPPSVNQKLLLGSAANLASLCHAMNSCACVLWVHV